MGLKRADIAALIPHGDAMCMLDEVVEWNQERIHCRSENFASASNPLFENGVLETVLLIEYAAQAAAVHAGLLQSQLGKARPAYIGAVKQIELLKPYCDNHLPIAIDAQCLLNNASGAIYEFTCSQASKHLITGRLILNQP